MFTTLYRVTRYSIVKNTFSEQSYYIKFFNNKINEKNMSVKSPGFYMYINKN